MKSNKLDELLSVDKEYKKLRYARWRLLYNLIKELGEIEIDEEWYNDFGFSLDGDVYNITKIKYEKGEYLEHYYLVSNDEKPLFFDVEEWADDDDIVDTILDYLEEYEPKED